jgi:hypothetical protein
MRNLPSPQFSIGSTMLRPYPVVIGICQPALAAPMIHFVRNFCGNAVRARTPPGLWLPKPTRSRFATSPKMPTVA